MKILVTGGAGFIGSHTVDGLLARGYRVKILDSLEEPVHPQGKSPYLPQGAEFLLGDVRERSDWEKALHGVDAVFHLAAYQDYLTDFSKFFHVNCVGTALLYEVIVEKRLPMKKVIVASSQAVMGEGVYRCPECLPDGASTDRDQRDPRHGLGTGFSIPRMRLEGQLQKGEWDHRCPACGTTLEPEPSREEVSSPENQYAMSKYSQELLALNLGKRYGIPTVAMRYSIVQGPRQSFSNAYSGVCRIFCLSLYFGNPPLIYEDGDQLRDYVNIDDVVEANLLVLEDDRADYKVFNVGGERAYTVREFFAIAAKVFESAIEPRMGGFYRYGDTRHILSAISRLKTLGWTPRHSPEKSVRDYREWLSRQKDIDDVLKAAERKMRERGVVRHVGKDKAT